MTATSDGKVQLLLADVVDSSDDVMRRLAFDDQRRLAAQNLLVPAAERSRHAIMHSPRAQQLVESRLAWLQHSSADGSLEGLKRCQFL